MVFIDTDVGFVVVLMVLVLFRLLELLCFGLGVAGVVLEKK